jgi:UDP-N-acetyl-2-amino-2-deoxyglucuronate dehydrogenase
VKRFALIGAAGYVAPKHYEAIRQVGGEVVAICDPSDSVGAIDRYFPRAEYFREVEVFDRHLDLLRRNGEGVDYLSICTPNYLHDAHCRLAMRNGADAICEKPVVLRPHNLRSLQRCERETGRTVHPILQLRCSSALHELKEWVDDHARDRPLSTPPNLAIEYHTFRGPWYGRSWKGRSDMSGGLIYNIGIHILDALLWVLGPVVDTVSYPVQDDAAGARFDLQCERGTAKVALSTTGEPAHRWISVDGHVPGYLGLDDLPNLHPAAYRAILDGTGLTLFDAMPAIELADRLTNGATQ